MQVYVKSDMMNPYSIVAKSEACSLRLISRWLMSSEDNTVQNYECYRISITIIGNMIYHIINISG